MESPVISGVKLTVATIREVRYTIRNLLLVRYVLSYMKPKRKVINDYQDYYRNVYLLSEHWKRLRKKKLRLNPICEKCRARKHLDVHHLRYKHLYDVLVEDLQTLCRRCHCKVHGKKYVPPRKGKSSKLSRFLKHRKKKVI